jgi:geranylgeranylglycerol-phosphate geranylgeranyltransferase
VRSLATTVRFARPFTLLAPALGMVSGGIAAVGFDGRFDPSGRDVLAIALGALMAALLNVASNGVNQIYDLEVDRINKPERPLPAGQMTVRQAWVVTVSAYAAALAVAALVNLPLLAIVAGTALLTYAYSGPPFRTKRHWLLANLTIATPRGFLLPLAGWIAVRGGAGFTDDLLPRDAWILAAASGLFILGAASTKDFADMEGDRAGGCITLPLRFGVPTAARLVAPFLVVPWVAVAALCAAGVLGGNAFVLFWGSVACALLGARTAWLLVRDPDALTRQSTHPSWVLMYLLMLLVQVVTALAYAVPRELLAGWAP